MALKIVFVLALFVGAAAQQNLTTFKANKAAAAKIDAEAKADQAKRSMINKVVTMITDLRSKVQKEREEEQITHLDFTRYCDTNVAKKQKSIAALGTAIGNEESSISSLALAITEHNGKVTTADGLIEQQKTLRLSTKATDRSAFATFETNMADMNTAIAGVSEAQAALKGSVGRPSLLQFQSASNTVSTAVMLGEALGLESAKSAGQELSLLQSEQPTQEMQDYDQHSDGIITMLETLVTDFQKTKNDLEVAEASRVGNVNMMLQAIEDETKAQTAERDTNQGHANKKNAKKAATQKQLKEDQTEKADDTEYLAKLQFGQAAKLFTFNQRQAAMKDEMDALTATETSLKESVMAKITRKSARFMQLGRGLHIAGAVSGNEGSMEMLEAQAEEMELDAPVGFLQKRSVSKHSGYDNMPDVLSLLKNQGQQWGSTVLLDMASHVSGDPLLKVKTLIENKITKLLQDADNEQHLAHCDKDIKETKEKRDMHKTNIADLTADIAENTALQNKLTDEIGKLNKAIEDLVAAALKSKNNRDKTKMELDTAEATAKNGTALMQSTIVTLKTFYAVAGKAEKSTNKGNANVTRTGFEDKAKAAASASKAGKVDPFAKAPDAGFDSEDTYGSDSSGGDSIIAMMDVIKSDFERTATKARSDNDQSLEDDKKFQADTELDRQEKLMVKKSRTSRRDETRDRTIVDLVSQKASQLELMGGTDSLNKAGEVETLKALMTKCKPPSMTYAQRVAKRNVEIASLNTAWDMLDKRKAYQQG